MHVGDPVSFPNSFFRKSGLSMFVFIEFLLCNFAKKTESNFRRYVDKLRTLMKLRKTQGSVVRSSKALFAHQLCCGRVEKRVRNLEVSAHKQKDVTTSDRMFDFI